MLKAIGACTFLALWVNLHAEELIVISRSSTGTALVSPVESVAMTRDASLVAFACRAPNLEGRLDGPGVYVWSASEDNLYGIEHHPGKKPEMVVGVAISPEGRYVAYVTNSGEAFLHDRVTKKTAELTNLDGTKIVRMGPKLFLSRDAAYIAFTVDSDSSDESKDGQVWLLERSSASVRLVSANSAGEPSTGKSEVAGLSEDGRYVLFVSNSKDLVGVDVHDKPQAYRFDRRTSKLEIVSLGPEGKPAEGGCSAAAMSSDGSVIAFLGWDVQRKSPEVCVRDLSAKRTSKIPWVRDPSRADLLLQQEIAVSGNGKHVLFVTKDENGWAVRVHSLEHGTSVIASRGRSGRLADAPCTSLAVDWHGNTVAYLSQARKLVPLAKGNTNAFVWFRDEAPFTEAVRRAQVELLAKLDVNQDGRIDRADVEEFQKHLGSADPRFDLNGDGSVDLRDLTIILLHAES